MEGARLLLTADAVGGVWSYSIDLAEALSRRGITVILVTLGPPPGDAKRRQAEAIPGLRLIQTDLPLDWTAANREQLRRTGLCLAELARDMHVDVVQLHAPALAMSGDWHAPVVSVMHSCVATWWQALRQASLPDDFMWRIEATRLGLLRSSLVVAPTQAFASQVQRVYGLSRCPAVVHNGRSPAGTVAALRSDSVVTFGRLWDEGKNAATIDRIAARLKVPVIAAGSLSGPNSTAIELHHAQAPGELTAPEIEALLAVRPIFVSAALYEPFGLGVLEAAQRGCALVLSDIPTFRELWNDAAIFVPPHDDAAFARSIETLLAEPEQRTRLGDAARTQSRRFDVDTLAESMISCFRSLTTEQAVA